MKIHCICMVKNEADVVAQALRAAAEWADAIYVYDNGSCDGSWQQVLALAKEVPALVPYKQEERVFRDSLRSEVFHEFRHRSRPGDWWCRLDADEFYLDNPRALLAEVPQPFDLVWSASFQYFFTDADAAQYRSDPARYDDAVPVEQKCRYYLNNWSEPRFFRDRRALRWKDTQWPEPLRRPFSRRIRLKHFQYRSPQQIQRRLDTRRALVEQNPGIFSHERGTDWTTHALRPTLGGARTPEPIAEHWEQRVVPARALHYDAHDGQLVLDEAAMPPITPLTPSLSRRLLRRVGALRGRAKQMLAGR